MDVCEKDPIIESVNDQNVKMVDIAAAKRSEDGAITISVVNKHDCEEIEIELEMLCDWVERNNVAIYTVNGASKDSYNDINNEQVSIMSCAYNLTGSTIKVKIAPHSVNVLVFK